MRAPFYFRDKSSTRCHCSVTFAIRYQLLQFSYSSEREFSGPRCQFVATQGLDYPDDLTVSAMKCPFCGFENDKVVDSRESKEADSIRRRRECLKCGKRFTTYERIDEIPYMVVRKTAAAKNSTGRKF